MLIEAFMIFCFIVYELILSFVTFFYTIDAATLKMINKEM